MGMSWENNGDLYIYPVILGYLIRIIHMGISSEK
jgi:hypothetical protein